LKDLDGKGHEFVGCTYVEDSWSLQAYTARVMKRRVFRIWAAWLLPLLALRALLPVGFMMSADADGLHLTFCPTQAPALVAALAATTAPNHAAHYAADGVAGSAALPSTHHSDAAVEIDAPCPYGLVCIAVAMEVPHPGADPAPLTDEFIDPPSPLLAGVGPTRAELIRGPPRLS
jgi:hypothetical protein